MPDEHKCTRCNAPLHDLCSFCWQTARFEILDDKFEQEQAALDAANDLESLAEVSDDPEDTDLAEAQLTHNE